MRIVFVAPEPIFPTNSGGRVDSLTVARALKCLGHEVHVRCFRHGFEDVEYSEEFDSFATIPRKSFLEATIASPFLPYQISSRQYDPGFTPNPTPDVVIAIQEWVLPVARKIAQESGADLYLRVANDEVFFLTSLAREETSWKKKFYLWLEVFRSRRLLRKKEFYSGITHCWPICEESAPPFLDTTVLAPVLAQNLSAVASYGSEKVLFIGTLDVSHTLRGVQWFVENVWPLVLEINPFATFLIGGRGSNQDHIINALSAKGVVILGELVDTTPYYAEASVFVNPVLSGSGVNMKVGPPASAGMPYVTTPIGTRGVPYLAEAMSVESTASGFAREISKLLSDQKYWALKSNEMRNRVWKEYSQKKMAEKLSSWLPEIQS